MKDRWGEILLKLLEKQENQYIYTSTLKGANVQVNVLISGFNPVAESAEIKTITAFVHPNLLIIYDYFPICVENVMYAGLVQEYYSKTLWRELEDRRRNKYPWNEEELWRYARELADVMGFMQWQGRYHGNIRPQSIYVAWDKGIKVGGWLDHFNAKNRHSLSIFNPYKADTKALGKILLGMCLLEWDNGSGNTAQRLSRLHCSEEFKGLLMWMLQDEERSRCDCMDLHYHLNPELERLEVLLEDVAEEIEENLHTNLAYTVRPSVGGRKES